MNRNWIAVCAVLWGSSIIWGAIPYLSNQELKEQSEFIVVGKVLATYERETEKENWRDRHGVIEVQITGQEKGRSLGEVVFVRFWTKTWIGAGDPPPHGSGHSLPKIDDQVKVYLHVTTDGLEALLPNGIQVLKPKR